MDLTQGTVGFNMAAYDFPPYSHSQPFLTEDSLGRKRLISPESQMAHSAIDKRIRHNSLEYVLDLNSQLSQPTFIRKPTIEDVMRGIENLTLNTVKREDLKDIATKQDILALEGNVKAQAAELSQLRSAFNKQQTEINSLKQTVDGNCAAILAAADRSAVQPGNLGHRMFTNNGGGLPQNINTQASKRYNLVVEGIPDIPIPEVYTYIIELADRLNVTLYKRDISNVSRILRRPGSAITTPGPVVIVFVHAHLRDAILRKKIDLREIEKYKTVYVNPDEPLETRRTKARFRRIAYLARQDGHVVSYRSDSIRIGDIEYRATDLSGIPPQYIPKDNPRPTATRQVDNGAVLPPTTAQAPGDVDTSSTQDDMETAPTHEQVPTTTVVNTQADVAQPPALIPADQHLTGRTQLRGGRICFAGETSFLSNFFMVCFLYCNIQYKSLEQCYHHTHAIMAKALELAQEIYNETDGVRLKSLAKRIPYCAEWAIVSEPKMDEMLDAKFSQNQPLMDQLMRTAPYELVEASVDKKWGGGEPWNSTKYDTGTFLGENKFGLKITGYRNKKLALLNNPTDVSLA